MWSNSKYKAVYRRVIQDRRTTWEEPNDIPPKDGRLEDLDRPTRAALRQAIGDNLLLSFRSATITSM